MEIFINFKQIKWHWNKTKQKKLEASLKLLDEYLISVKTQENNTEALRTSKFSIGWNVKMC